MLNIYTHNAKQGNYYHYSYCRSVDTLVTFIVLYIMTVIIDDEARIEWGD